MRRSSNQLCRRRSGFTLIELMIVVAIVGLLASMAIPMFQNYAMRARFAERAIMVAAMEQAILTHFGEHDTFPSVNSDGVLWLNWNPRGGLNSERESWYDDPDWAFFSPPAAKLYFRYVGWGNIYSTSAYFCIEARGDLDMDGDPSRLKQCWMQSPYVGAMNRIFSLGVATPPGVF